MVECQHGNIAALRHRSIAAAAIMTKLIATVLTRARIVNKPMERKGRQRQPQD